MTWEEFLNTPINSHLTGQIQTDIECPKCGRKIYLNERIILTSYPAKYAYWCACGWDGAAPIKWRGVHNESSDNGT